MYRSKTFLTNFIALLLVVLSFFIPTQLQKYFLYTGLFALSGGLTNWLAVHMIFNKVPFLYGSGVIEKNFEKFKISLQSMVMEQFFSSEKIEDLLKDGEVNIDLLPLIEEIDFEPAFESLKDGILKSKIGSVVAMFGGATLIDNQKETIVKKFRKNIVDIVSSDTFTDQLKQHFKKSHYAQDISIKIESIVSRRIDELTPLAVKELAFDLMGVHLGWLVVWGGIFGGFIGFVSSFVL